MPVTKSAKKALRTATRRHEENLIQKETYKKAAKAVRKAAVAGSETAELLSKAQSAFDRAAKNNTIQKNKAARLKSRLAKLIAASGAPAGEAAPKKAAVKKASTATKKAAPKKAAAKKA